MKNILLLFALLTATAVTLAQQPKKAAAPAKADVIVLKTPEDSAQYVLGAYLGQYISSNGFAITNANLFIQGMNDALSGKGLKVDAKSVSAKIGEYQSRMGVERSKALEKQLFDAIKGQPGLGVLPNGVCYSIVKAGQGIRPRANDSIQVHIKGFLPDGRMIEDTYKQNTPYNTTPAGLIAGISEVMQIMPEGSLWKVFVPSIQAYGEKGLKDVIPPYSALVYELELIKVK